MVATQISWWPDVIFFRSTDAGATWTRAWDWGAWPDRVLRYSIDITESPWLTWNQTPGPARVRPEAGLDDRVGGDRPVRLQPPALRHRGDHLRHRQPHRLGRRARVRISVRARGLEETAVLDLISPPAGRAPALGRRRRGWLRAPRLHPPRPDVRQPDVRRRPRRWTTPGSPRASIVRVGNPSGSSIHFGVSTDGGATWTPAAHRAGRRHRRRDGRRGGRRHAGRLVARRRRGRASARPTTAPPGRRRRRRAGRRAGGVRPGRRPSTFYALRGRGVLRQHRRRRDVRGGRHRPAGRGQRAVQGGARARRRHLAGRRQGPACRTDCGARPTAVPRSPAWPAWTRATRSASGGPRRAGPTRPCSASPRSAACAASSAPTTRAGAGCGSTTTSTSGPGPARHHRRPPGLRPGLRGHQRSRHHRRRPRLMHARAPCNRLARYRGTLLTRRVRSRRGGRPATSAL